MIERRRELERGFTVPEILISLVLIVGIGLVTLAVVQIFGRALGMRSSAQGGTVALEQQLESMRGDAATAYAVFVPQKDVHGAANAPAPSLGMIPSGHEVDFYSRTDAGQEAWWAYTYDAATQTLQRFDYDAAGNVGVADRNTGVVDPSAHYPPLTGVTAFSASVLEADQLANGASAFAPLVAGLTSGSAVHADPVGFVPKSGTPRPDLYGGNVTVQVQLATDRGTRTLHLASAALPSGFTIHQTPSIRAVTYRIDIVHNFWWGAAQITHSQIYNQLLYSYDPNAPPDRWHVWCDWELYGSGIAGLRLGDPATKYQPTHFNESAPGIYYAVTNAGPNGNGTTGLNEQPGCHKPVPGPNATHPPVPLQTDPDVTDTPPPCFTAGTCWPENAPPNWTPPSPWPTSTPPAGWCATHAESPLCGGAGGTPVPSYSSPSPVAYYSPAPATPGPEPSDPRPLPSFRAPNPHHPGNPL